MHFNDFTAKLSNYQSKGNNQGWACCPAHDDQHPSLSVWLDSEGKIAYHCKAGCSHSAVLAALNLKEADLYTDDAVLDFNSEIGDGATRRGHECWTPEAVYEYLDVEGNRLQKRRYRKPDGTKTFLWKHLDENDCWVKGSTGKPIMPYNYNHPRFDEAGGEIVFIVEGEKDVDTCVTLNLPNTVSLANGAESRWHPEFDGIVLGKAVVIIPDCDKPGAEYARRIAASCSGKASAIKIVDLNLAWQQFLGEEKAPDKADITDFLNSSDKETAKAAIRKLSADTELWQASPAGQETDEAAPLRLEEELADLFPELSTVEASEPEWLIPNAIPAGTITVIAGEGGLGKTSLACNLIAGISAGKPTILDPDNVDREPGRVLILSAEDSVSCVLKPKLLNTDANMENIRAMDFSRDKNGALQDMRLGYPMFNKVVRSFNPKLVVIDPLQSFVPPNVNMASRNGIRDCVQPLLTLGAEAGITFLLLAHTNKLAGVFGRNRIADSSDIWDCARCVWMMGKTETDDVLYLSNEKNSYAPHQRTILFKQDDNGVPVIVGESTLNDEYYQSHRRSRRDDSGSVVEAIAQEIIDMLQKAPDKRVSSNELRKTLQEYGHSGGSIQRARDSLRQKKIIRVEKCGNRSDAEWFVVLNEGKPAPGTTSQPSGQVA